MMLRLRPTGRDGTDGEDGVSLIETMIAILVLSVGVLALASSAFASLTANGDARNRQLATDAMTAALESARAHDYDDLSMATGDIDADADPYLETDGAGDPIFDHDGDGTDPAEKLITDAAGPISPYIVQEEQRTIRTYVTWFDNPDVAGSMDSKRVTVVTTYDAGGTTRELRESTVVAKANRGLAAPDFEVAPAELAVTEQADQTVCFDHSLINDGEQDKHSFTVDGWTDFGDHVVGPSGWEARAYVDGLQMTDTSGDLRPDSAVFLPRGGTLPLQVCYDVPADLSEGTSHTWTAEFYSSLDPTVMRSITNTVVVGAPGSGTPSGTTHPGFLLRYDADNAVDRTFVMNSGDIVRTSLTDYDVNGQDSDGLPGWMLNRAGENSENATRWDWQYTGNGNVKLDGTATLEYYSAWRDALLSGSTTSVHLEYEFKLQVLNTAQTVKRTLATEVDSYDHEVGGWENRTLTFNFSSLGQPDKTIARDEYLRLEVRCLGVTGEQDCHMAFDALVDGGPTYSSALDVPGASS